VLLLGGYQQKSAAAGFVSSLRQIPRQKRARKVGRRREEDGGRTSHGRLAVAEGCLESRQSLSTPRVLMVEWMVLRSPESARRDSATTA
jgi:hypothetical protein